MSTGYPKWVGWQRFPMCILSIGEAAGSDSAEPRHGARQQPEHPARPSPILRRVLPEHDMPSQICIEQMFENEVA